MSEQLKRAAELLRREAQILRESNPDSPERRGRGGEWNGNVDAKQDHDELLDAAEIVDKAIERLASQSQTVVKVTDSGFSATGMTVAYVSTIAEPERVTDRQLADAVNELRDIAIKFHAAGQLRERIAGVVRGLVRGESTTVAVDARAMAELLEQAAEDIQEWGAYASAYFQEKHNLAANVAKYREAASRLLAGGG